MGRVRVVPAFLKTPLNTFRRGGCPPAGTWGGAPSGVSEHRMQRGWRRVWIPVPTPLASCLLPSPTKQQDKLPPRDHTGQTVPRPTSTSAGRCWVIKLLLRFHPRSSSGQQPSGNHGGVQEDPVDSPVS